MSIRIRRLQEEVRKIKNKVEHVWQGNFNDHSQVLFVRKRRWAFSGIAVFLALIIGFTAIYGPFTKSYPTFVSDVPILSAKKASYDFGAYPNVEKFEVPNAKATVIYIPQIHREPTSNPNDKTNDQAAIIQKDIYKTLESLVDNNHINYVMDETDLYGPMPEDKVSKIKRGLSDSEDFRNSLDKTIDHYIKDGGDQNTADQIRKNGEASADRYERNIYLTGGAAVLAATNQNAHVYGSQNASTINEARDRLQDLMYLESRINELKGKSNSGQASSQGKNASNPQIQQILNSISSKRKSAPAGNAKITDIKAFAEKNNDTELSSQVDETLSKSKNLSTSKSFETSSGATAQKASTSTNPYQNSTNLSHLEHLYSQKYAEFMKIAKDRRSQEVADNIEKQMDENNQSSGILVFGEQHKEQIVSALNKKGINVIVIMPQSEKEYITKQAQAAAVTKNS